MPSTIAPGKVTELSAEDAAVIPAAPPDAPPEFVRKARRLEDELAIAWVDEVLDRAYSAVAQERPLEATDLLIERFDALFLGEDAVRARLLLKRLDLPRLKPEVLTALLPLASHGHEMLGEAWIEFRNRSLRALEEHWHFTKERCQRLLERLG